MWGASAAHLRLCDHFKAAADEVRGEALVHLSSLQLVQWATDCQFLAANFKKGEMLATNRRLDTE